MLSECEIVKLIQDGENSYIEFKEDPIDNKKLAKEIVGLSNHKGGFIFLGVNDNGEIIGLTRTDNEERIMIYSLVQKFCDTTAKKNTTQLTWVF